MYTNHVIVIHPFDVSGARYGGIESVIADLIRYAPDDVEFSVVGITTRSSEMRVGRWYRTHLGGRMFNFFPVLRVRDPNRPTAVPLMLRYTLALQRWKKRVGFADAVVIYHRIEPAYVLHDVQSIKEILFVHGDIRRIKDDYSDSKWKRISWLYFLLERFFIKRMQQVFVVSQTGLDYYKSRYPGLSSRFSFVPMWPDTSTFKRMAVDRASVLSAYGVIDRNPVLLFVGRLELVKDPLLLISSCSFVHKVYPNLAVVIVGEGSMESSVRELASKLHISENVYLVGRRRQQEIAQLMNSCDLLVVTSAFEGMPKVVLEGLACGLPVVSTRVGEVSLVVKDGMNGYLCGQRDPRRFASEILRLLKRKPKADTCIKSVSDYLPDNVVRTLFEEMGIKQ